MVNIFLHNLIRLITDFVLIFIFIKFRYKPRIDKKIPLTKKQEDELIESFQPKPIIDINLTKGLNFGSKVYNCNLLDFCDYDFFNLKTSNKKKLSEIIKEYGIGTCGPRGFYGTLDLHIILEKILANICHKEAAVLYSNHFTCVNSLISCFVKSYDTIFYHKDASEPILRGIECSNASSIEFYDLKSLETKIKMFKSKTQRNFLIIEEIFKNTGLRPDINLYLKICMENNFFFILDRSQTFPFMEISSDILKKVDIIIGSLNGALCSSGAFVATNFREAEYQTLASPSYCFSASSPAYLTGNAILNLQRYLSFPLKKISYFRFLFQKFNKTNFKLNLENDHPVIFVYRDFYDITFYEEINICINIKKNMENKGFRIGLMRVPSPRIRICLKSNVTRRVMEYFVAKFVDCLYENLQKNNKN